MTPAEISALPYRPCVGVMLINDQGLVFAAQRIDSDVAAWQMPQGGIDPGETPTQAALRELWEETSVNSDLVDVLAQAPNTVQYELPHDLVPKLWKGRFRGQEQHWFLMRFKGTDADIDLATEHQEFSDWVWLSTDDLVDKIVPFKRAVYQDVVAAFKDYL